MFYIHRPTAIRNRKNTSYKKGPFKEYLKIKRFQYIHVADSINEKIKKIGLLKSTVATHAVMLHDD